MRVTYGEVITLDEDGSITIPDDVEVVELSDADLGSLVLGRRGHPGRSFFYSGVSKLVGPGEVERDACEEIRKELARTGPCDAGS